MKKTIIIFILCISTKSFSQLVSNARNANISTLKTNEDAILAADSTQNNITVLNSMGRFEKPIIINSKDVTNRNKVVSEKKRPQVISTKRRQ